MAEYIEKQAAMDAIHNHYEVRNPDQNAVMDEVSMIIFRIPPADVRPVRRGEWIDERWHGMPVFSPVPYLCFATCSTCKQESIVNIKRGKKEWEIDSDICPRCGSYNGADMRGGDADGNEKD